MLDGYEWSVRRFLALVEKLDPWTRGLVIAFMVLNLLLVHLYLLADPRPLVFVYMNF